MLRVLYAGSPEASAVTLKLLAEKAAANGFEIVGVLTNAPTAKGRHKELVPTPVGLAARELNLPVFEPEHLDTPAREAVAQVNADIMVVFAYGHIFGPKFMGLFKFGGINLHPSALPVYRGCTPVNAAILNGDTETAFTIQKVSKAMDEGNILAQQKVTLSGNETAGSLLNDAAVAGADLIAKVLSETSAAGDIAEGTPQSGSASYTGFITKDDAKIDWNKSAVEIDRAVRGYFPDPNAWTLENGAPLKIMSGVPLSDDEAVALGADLSSTPGTVAIFAKPKGILIRCGGSFYAVTKLQRQGKSVMDYKSFMNGARDFIGKTLGL